MRMFRSGAALLCGLLAAAGLTDVAGATSAPTGNAKAIAFYRSVVNATRAHSGVVVTQTGYVLMTDELGRSSSFSFTFGIGSRRPGYVPAVEHITIAAVNRRISWVSDDMVPEGCTAQAGGSCLPVELLLYSGGLLWRFDSPRLPASSSCWSSNVRAGTEVAGYTKTGVASGYALYGYFYPVKRVGGSDEVTSTYPWGKTQKATEVDTISLATRLPTSSVVHVSAAPGAPAFTYRWTNQWLAKAPVMPRTTMCG